MGQKLLEDVAAVLNQLMADSEDATSVALLEAKTERKGEKVARSTIHRARNAESALGIDMLDAIANAFGLKAWEILRMAQESRASEKKKPYNSQETANTGLVENGWLPELTTAQQKLRNTLLSVVSTIDDDQAQALTLIIQRSVSPVSTHTPIRKVPKKTT